jgi:uncharacterized protein YabE (DUF348 family)/3D (Asp-Asp-Asp) domain-containing protein
MTPKLFRRLGITFIGLAVLVTVVSVGYLTAAVEDVTVYVSNSPLAEAQAVTVRGQYETVGEVLLDAGISLTPHDAINIPLSAAPPSSASEAIHVQKALAVTLITDEAQTRLWTLQPNLGAFLRENNVEMRRTDRIFADNQLVAFNAIEDTAIPQTVQIGRFLSVFIEDGSEQLVLRTEAQTVGEALKDAGIRIYAADGVMPPTGTWLTPDTRIIVRRSVPLTIQLDGQTIQTRSHHTNSLDVLADAGIGLVGLDYPVPGPETPLNANDTIRIVRVTEDFRLIDEEIPFETTWQGTDQLEIDTRGLLQAGIPGIVRRRIRVRYEDGVEVSQKLDGEWVAAEPLNEIMGFGTNITIRVLDTPTGPVEYWRVVRMRVTSYTASSSGKDPDHPAYGITASGQYARKGIVAIDRSVVPWGSHVYVEGYGIGKAGDTGGGVIGRWIDLGYSESNYVGWSGYTDVYYLTPVPEPDRINYLIPNYLP